MAQVNAQVDAVYSWAKGYGSTGSDQNRSVATDASGNVYTVGFFGGSITSFGLTNAGNNDILITKHNAAGVLMWTKGIGGIGEDRGISIAVDANSNVYITGSFQNTVDFDPSPSATANLTYAGGNGDIFLAKYDAGGNYVWAKVIGGTGAENGSGIALDSSSNVYIIGQFQNTVDFDPSTSAIANQTSAGIVDVYVAKYDANGNYIWAISMGNTGSDQGYGIIVDASSNMLCITGLFDGTVDFDPSSGGTANLTTVGSQDIFFAKYDFSGNYIWAKNIGSIGFDQGYGIAVDANSNLYITGVFTGTVDFDPSPTAAVNITSVGGNDIYLAKYDGNGNYVWAKGFGSTNFDVGYGIAVDISSHVYIIGVFNNTVDFDPSTSVTANLTSVGGNDIFMAKYDASGNYVWAKGIGNTSFDVGYGIAVDVSSQVYITGAFSGIVDFDPSPTATTNLISVGASDIFVGKYSQTGMCTSNTGIFTVSACNNYTWAAKGNTIYTSSNNTDTIHLTNIGGCDSVVTLNLTIQHSTSSTTNTSICATDLPYSWNNLTLFTAGIQIAHFINVAGCDSAATLNLTINIATSSTTNVTVCSNSLPYVWNSNAYNIAGTYTLHYTNAAGCDSAATLNLTVNNISQNSTNATACDSYTWNVNNQTYTSSGTYQVVTGCHTETLNLTIYPSPTITASSNTSVCAGSSVNLSGSGAASYSWSNGISNGVSFVPTSTTTYTVTGTTNGCSDTAQTTVIVNPLPTVNAGADKLICPGTSTSLTATGAVSYSWSGGISNGTSFSPSATTTYVVTGTDVNNCTNKDTVIVAIRDLKIASTSNIICSGAKDTLTAPSGSNYQWKKNGVILSGKTSQVLVVTAFGSYTVTYQDSLCGLKTSPAMVLAIQNSPAQPTLNASSTALCPGFSTTLSATPTTYSYQWYLGTAQIPTISTVTYTTSVAGTYKIRAVDSFGCLSPFSKTKVITAKTAPIPSLTITNAPLGAKKLTSIKATTYQWSINGANISGATTQNYIATVSGNYSITITNSAGCSASIDAALTITYTGPKMSQDELLLMDIQENIKVYPNPSTGIFYIETTNATKAIVTDIQGRKALETTNMQKIDLSQNPAGIYFLQLMNEEGILLKTEKLIKE